MELMGVVDISWGGKLPVLWLYDHEGKQAERFEGGDAPEKAGEKLKRLGSSTVFMSSMPEMISNYS